jgi:hypothetical protein
MSEVNGWKTQVKETWLEPPCHNCPYPETSDVSALTLAPVVVMEPELEDAHVLPSWAIPVVFPAFIPE